MCVCVCVCVSHSELFGESRDVFLRESPVQSGDMVPQLERRRRRCPHRLSVPLEHHGRTHTVPAG